MKSGNQSGLRYGGKKVKVTYTGSQQIEYLSELPKPEQDEEKWQSNRASMLQPENICNIPQVTELR